MKAFQVKIGEHIFDITLHSNLLSDWFDQDFNVIDERTDECCDMYIQIKDGYGHAFIDYEVEIDHKDGKINYKRADYLIEVDSGFQQAVIHVHDWLALKHALMNLYSSFLVHHQWGLLIHSSCVLENEKGHIFAGHSGSGKSTAAMLSTPRMLLSDEATIVKISSNGAMIYNSPFRSDIAAEQKEGIFRLYSIQILHQAVKNEKLPVAKADAVIKLMDKIFYWPYSPVETKMIMNLLIMLVRNVQVNELYFQKNNTFWELIS
ncbi:hypothetical protein [Falsibacillus albus]|uniref:Uncharacterized protein n=1 Tax=Falsibacillus albus TaxID=2478915 RepID=A0A3L7JZZ7_9BACI|nr:hypothetical protein [Falsibacillus albus]RLQ96346.1 hypothetical protein D9X91_08280 [Falsibacillus albus]